MRIFLLLCLLIGAGIPSLWAQDRIIFEETFSNNFLRWMHGSSPAYSAKVENGVYKIEYKQDQGAWYFWQSVPIYPDTNFHIHSIISPYLKTQRSVYGLIWGVKDLNNYNGFLISNQGALSVVSCKNGVFERIVDWKFTGNYQNNQTHRVEIKQTETEMEYYLDGKLSLRSPKLPFYGDLMGFMISGKTYAEIDALTVRQDRTIHLVDDAIQGNLRKNLGTAINSPYAELHPVVSHDGQQLFVTRKGHPDNLGVEKKDDAWIAKRQPDGSWGTLINMGRPINNDNHNQVISIAPDNNTLLIGNTYFVNGHSKGKGISITHQQDDDQWVVPNEVFIDNFYNQNPIHSIHLTANQQLLLLAIERKDSYGHLDLYVSFLQPSGRFSTPHNLGSTINTAYEEGTPFLAADGKTLYFSSYGHAGYGSADIFVSKRLDDTWTNWSPPKNLGPEINTHQWEGHYSIPASGDRAYLVSNLGEGHIGAEDVYEVIPPNSARPEPVLLVRGRVFHAQSKVPLEAYIFYYNQLTHRQEGNARSNVKDGAYQIILPSKNNYRFWAIKEGYYPVNVLLDVDSMTVYAEKEVHLYLHPIEVGANIPLIGLDQLTEGRLPATLPPLDHLTKVLKKYPDMQIKLKDDDPKLLEQYRHYLSVQGIDPKRLQLMPSKDLDPSFEIIAMTPFEKDIKERSNFDPQMPTAKMQVGQVLRLNRTLFAADSSSLRPEVFPLLDELVSFLEKHPSLTIEIGGHTNGLPSHAYSDALSEARASEVQAYLIQKDIPIQRLSIKGYGKRHPIASNKTLEGRQRNQRVEIKILSLKEGKETKPKKQQAGMVIPDED